MRPAHQDVRLANGRSTLPPSPLPPDKGTWDPFSPPEFSSLIVSRPGSRPLLLARARGLALAGSLYALLLVALILAPLFVLEVVHSPEANVDLRVPITFRPPHGRGDDQPAGNVRHGTPGGRKNAATPHGAPRPAVPRPAESPLPPPEAQAAIVSGPAGPEDGSDGPSGLPDGTGDNPDGVLNGGCPGCNGTGPSGLGDDAGPLDEGTPGLIPPTLLAGSRALPKYPDLARRAGLQGTVVLLAVVEKDGTVGEIEVVKSPDQRWGFDLAAIDAVKQWRYQPALLNGAPVAAYIQVMVEFTLAR
jgi:periplasmic protein TonB